jgi:hypothetical protein
VQFRLHHRNTIGATQTLRARAARATIAVVRGILAMLVLCLAACASSQPPMDGGVDLTAGQCDPRMIFADCSAQCQMPICIVATADCSPAGQWICNCAQTTPCGADMRVQD